ncbi:MAG: sugar phosphate isomerase/epimerase [Vicinamibacterales bacterium]
MLTYTRREFGSVVCASLAMPIPRHLMQPSPAEAATVRGVRIGAITGVYGPFAPGAGQDVVDVVIARSLEGGIGHVEFVNSLLEPRVTGGAVGGQAPATASPEYLQTRSALRQWRLAQPLERFREIRQKFDAAGLDLFSYVITVGDDFTDPEIEAVFKQMQALGVRRFCTNQTRVGMGPRMVPFAEKYRISPAFHTHSLVNDPNEVASPASLDQLLGMSRLFMVNLDIGHFARGGNDPFAYIKEHHDRITHLHIRDMKRDGSAANVGDGDLQVADLLRAIRDNKWPIGCILEQGRTGFESSVAATRANLDYMRKALES